MNSRAFKPGDRIVYQMTKYTGCPGPRAHDIRPDPRGENYQYGVDKFWVVDSIDSSGLIVARTRRGKSRVLDSDDPDLRRPTLWERLRYAKRFPEPRPEARPARSL